MRLPESAIDGSLQCGPGLRLAPCESFAQRGPRQLAKSLWVHSFFRQKSNPGDHPWGKVRQLVVSGDSAEALLKPFELFPLNYKYPRVRVAADTHGLNHQQHVLTRGRSLVSEEGDFIRRYL